MGAYLTDPEVAKVTTVGETATFAFAVSAMQGWRDSMEDYCVVDLEVGQGAVCLGVLDGHGGKEVAAFAAGHLARSIAGKLSSNTVETVLKDSFLEVDEALRTGEVQAQLGNSLGDGTTGEVIANEQGCAALISLLMGSDVYIANAGDCRCVMGVNGQAIQLTTDHKPILPLERERIVAAGSTVVDGRVNDILDLSRGLGDLVFKGNADISAEAQAITALPDVIKVKITPNTDFMVMATDGVWDVLTSEACVDFVYQKMRGKGLKEVAEGLLGACLASDPNNLGGLGCDNMACVLIRFSSST
jgi:serine/threonine protein phosphatase PrpC